MIGPARRFTVRKYQNGKKNRIDSAKQRSAVYDDYDDRWPTTTVRAREEWAKET